MLTGTDENWAVMPEMVRAARSCRGGNGRDGREPLDALHGVTIRNVTRRADPRLPCGQASAMPRAMQLS